MLNLTGVVVLMLQCVCINTANWSIYYSGVYFIAGVDYEPVNTRITFSESMRAHNIEIVTIDDDMFESEGNAERICLRMVNLTEPCPNSVTIGPDEVVLIAEDDCKIPMDFIVVL